jgi:hypothetical protein
VARSWQCLAKLACIVPCLGKSLEFNGPSIAVLLSEANLTQTFIAQIKQRQKECSVRIASRPRVDDCNGSCVCPQKNMAFVIVGAIMILVAFVCLALFVFSSKRRVNYMNKMKLAPE